MLKSYLFFIILLSQLIGLGQTHIKGKSVKASFSQEITKFFSTSEYTIVAVKKKSLSLPYLTSLSTGSSLDLPQLDSYILYKYMNSNLSFKKKEFSIKRQNRIIGSFFSKNKFITLSLNKKDQKKHIYVDIIDCDKLKPVIVNKEIIKFNDKKNRKLIHSELNSKGGYDLIFENLKLVNYNLILEHFSLNSDFKVISYQKLQIPSKNKYWILSEHFDLDKKYFIFKNAISYKTDSLFYNTIGVLNITKDTFEFSDYAMADNRVVRDFEFYKKNDKNLVFTLLTNKSGISTEFYTFGKDTTLNRKIDLPEAYIERLTSFYKITNKSVINYDFILFENGLFKIENFVTSVNEYGQEFHDYGPALIGYIDTKLEFKWYKIISKKDESKLKSPIAIININESLSHIVYRLKDGIKIESISINSGEFTTIQTGPLNEKKASKYYVINRTNKKNKNFFYVSKYFSNKLYPILYHIP